MRDMVSFALVSLEARLELLIALTYHPHRALPLGAQSPRLASTAISLLAAARQSRLPA